MARILQCCLSNERQQHAFRVCFRINAVSLRCKEKTGETKLVGGQTIEAQWVEIIRVRLADTVDADDIPPSFTPDPLELV